MPSMMSSPHTSRSCRLSGWNRAGLIFLVLCGLSIPLLHAQELSTEDPAPESQTDPTPNPAEGLPTKAFIPLSPEDSFNELVAQALSAFEAENYDEALKYLDAALTFAPKSPFVLNLRGAVFTKKKDFEAARKNFEAAVAIDPQFFPARFNLGEVLFLEGRYEEALSFFELLNSNYLRNELIQFKLIILFALTDRREDAARTLQRLRFPGETPAWYYSHAAFRALEGDKRDSRRYLKAARAIFPESQLSLYEESMEESHLLN